MIRCISRLLKDETATVSIEYGLVMTIISVIAIASMIAIGGSISTFLDNASAGLSLR